MRPKYNLCVLFLYHKRDELTLAHFASLQKHNPDACIIPLTSETLPEPLPGTVNVAGFPSRWESSGPWRNTDLTVYRWFEKNPKGYRS